MSIAKRLMLTRRGRRGGRGGGGTRAMTIMITTVPVIAERMPLCGENAAHDENDDETDEEFLTISIPIVVITPTIEKTIV